MAIVKFVASGCPMNNIFPYVMNREKTDENLISGINCSPDTALQEFTFVKKQFKKEDGRTYVHIVQAFSPDDDITPELAHEIGLRFAEYFDGFQALVATHRNTDHIHNHIILNSVNMETGKKFHQSAAEMRQVKEYSNKLCREYGLSETETKSSFKSMLYLVVSYKDTVTQKNKTKWLGLGLPAGSTKSLINKAVREAKNKFESEYKRFLPRQRHRLRDRQQIRLAYEYDSPVYKEIKTTKKSRLLQSALFAVKQLKNL